MRRLRERAQHLPARNTQTGKQNEKKASSLRAATKRCAALQSFLPAPSCTRHWPTKGQVELLLPALDYTLGLPTKGCSKLELLFSAEKIALEWPKRGVQCWNGSVTNEKQKNNKSNNTTNIRQTKKKRVTTGLAKQSNKQETTLTQHTHTHKKIDTHKKKKTTWQKAAKRCIVYNVIYQKSPKRTKATRQSRRHAEKHRSREAESGKAESAKAEKQTRQSRIARNIRL